MAHTVLELEPGRALPEPAAGIRVYQSGREDQPFAGDDGPGANPLRAEVADFVSGDADIRDLVRDLITLQIANVRDQKVTLSQPMPGQHDNPREAKHPCRTAPRND